MRVIDQQRGGSADGEVRRQPIQTMECRERRIFARYRRPRLGKVEQGPGELGRTFEQLPLPATGSLESRASNSCRMTPNGNCCSSSPPRARRTSIPISRPRLAASARRRLFPMPGSPRMDTKTPLPARTASSNSCRRSSSRSLSTSCCCKPILLAAEVPAAYTSNTVRTKMARSSSGVTRE
jgi:hypothetical protein